MKEWLLITGMVILTFIPRLLPMAMANRFHISPLLRQALEFVPIAVLTAIVAQVALVHDGELDIAANNPYIYGAMAAVVVALRSQHLFTTVIAGLLVYLVAYLLI